MAQMSKKSSVSKETKRRKIQLIRRNIIATLFVISVSAFLALRMISDKEKLRDEGVLLYNEGRYTESIEKLDSAYYEKQWFTDAMDADILMYKADAYLKMNMYPEAHDTYYKLQQEYAKYVDSEKISELLNMTQSLVYVENGLYDDAVSGLAIAVNDGYTDMNMYLGACYQKQGAYDSMLSAYNTYLATYPMNTYIAYQMSSYYMDTEVNMDMARSYIDQGLSCTDDVYLEELKLNEIIYYEKINDYQTAFSAAEQFIADYPENETGRAEYDFLYTRVNIDPVPVHIEEEDEGTLIAE